MGFGTADVLLVGASLILYAGVLGRSVSAGGDGPRLSASRQMAGIEELYVNAIGVRAGEV